MQIATLKKHLQLTFSTALPVSDLTHDRSL